MNLVRRENKRDAVRPVIAEAKGCEPNCGQNRLDRHDDLALRSSDRDAAIVHERRVFDRENETGKPARKYFDFGNLGYEVVVHRNDLQNGISFGGLESGHHEFLPPRAEPYLVAQRTVEAFSIDQENKSPTCLIRAAAQDKNQKSFSHCTHDYAFEVERSRRLSAKVNRLGSRALRRMFVAGLFLAASVSAASAIGHPNWIDDSDYIESAEVLFVEKMDGKRRYCEAVIYRLIDRPDTSLREFRIVDTFKVAMRECRR